MSCLLFPSIYCHPHTLSSFLISSPLSSPEVYRLAGRLVWLPAYLLHHHHCLLWRTWSSVFFAWFPSIQISPVNSWWTECARLWVHGWLVGWLWYL
ncbi:uncharacterized protein BO87DRAFT_104509 [Aspergillus neoniger CBS 115656]|uniref:Uncharacterized protein n=1 Tax=Aspergillus neoniger (strain CBS 115656) TaxID=1448310 RepID=A0A318YJ66_ASPNB|nr:hypothetical protein BO87DRAFT_104509 [Aspergillus neoniger CBS 115656]PYH32613.1 hypothetical protein BO87DRAFT_104509 [Aspergillus neoniger CBS 115656]